MISISLNIDTPYRREHTPDVIIRFFCVVLHAIVLGGAALTAFADGPAVFDLAPAIRVDGQGVFLAQLLTSTNSEIPQARIAAAPGAGQTLLLTRRQIQDWLRTNDLAAGSNVWTGAMQTKVTRKTRALEEEELHQLVQDTLQHEVVRERGELEIRFQRSIPASQIPDEPVTVRILDRAKM